MSKPINIPHKKYNIPFSNSDTKLPPITNILSGECESPRKLSCSAPIDTSIIQNYMSIKTDEVLQNKSDILPIVGTSPSLKPNNFAEKSLNSIKNLLNFKL